MTVVVPDTSPLSYLIEINCEQRLFPCVPSYQELSSQWWKWISSFSARSQTLSR